MQMNSWVLSRQSGSDSLRPFGVAELIIRMDQTFDFYFSLLLSDKLSYLNQHVFDLIVKALVKVVKDKPTPELFSAYLQ